MKTLRPYLSMLFAIALLCGLYLAVYQPLQVQRAASQDAVEILQGDISALKERIRYLGAANPAQEFPDTLLWRASSKADAELALQDAVIRVAASSGVSPRSFGTSGLGRDTTQETIAIELEAEGSINQAYTFLAQLEQLTPQVAVGMMRLRPARGYGAPAEEVRVFCQISVWAFWEPAI